MGSSSDRLPSFKGPRDLSLSARGNKREAPPTGTARPRRVFTPNIPPKRDRGATATAPSSSQQSHSKEIANASGSRGRGRGRGGGRGGSRPPKQKAELIQSESIFSEGVGDPTEVKRSSSIQYRSGYGGGRYKSGGDGGTPRMSSINKSTLTTMLKEEDEASKKIFGADDTSTEEQDQSEELSQDNPYMPVVLPLIRYETFIETPSPAESTRSDSPEAATVQTENRIEQSSSSGFDFPRVKIKEEVVDDNDAGHPTLISIKQEKVDVINTNEKNQKLLKSMPLDPTSFAATYRESAKGGSSNGTLVYFQLPDELPVLESSVRESADQPISGKNASNLVRDINDLPEGLFGRLQILSSGRARFIIGENYFDIDSGRPVGFRQELHCVDIENKSMTRLDGVSRKFVITPDIERIISSDPIYG